MKAEINTHCQKLFRISLRLLLVSTAALLVSGCSGTIKSSESMLMASGFMPSGSITISRPAPDVAPISNPVLLGLLPGSIPALVSPTKPTGTWVAISRRDASISVMDGNSTVYKFKGEGLGSVNPGTYKLLHKQRNPLWYAPDSYFSKRGIAVPPAGDRARFRRGAFGDFVIFLNKDTPIHSGPIWSEDLGGARMDESDMSRVYYKVESGTPIHVE